MNLWDQADEKPTPVETNPILERARKANAELDTTAVIAEMDAEALARQNLKEATDMGMVPPPQQQVGTKGITLPPLNIDYGSAKTALERAKIAVAEYNKQFTFGERVLAKNKRLINAMTDLNQLIPFKYSWAWSMYLESTNAHWMPPEIEGYMKDCKDYPNASEINKTNVSRLVVSYIYGNLLYPPVQLMNLYRLSTNPEVRQYILRQAFEEQGQHHSMRHIIECFDLNNDDILKQRDIESVFRERNTLLAPYVALLNDLAYSTETEKSIGAFIVALATLYGGMRGLYHLVPMMALWLNHRDTGVFGGVSQNVEYILRDFNRQWDFGIRYINGIIEENPNVLNREVIETVQTVFAMLVTFNREQADKISLTPEHRESIKHCTDLFANRFLRDIGFPTEAVTPNQQHNQFFELFFSLNNTDHTNAAASLTGGQGGLGDWGDD